MDPITAADTPIRSNAPRRLDRAVALVLLTRVVPLLTAPVTLWLVATRRPLLEQGPYFVFWNTQALTQLTELGVGALIVQFASHEWPSLSWNASGALIGDAATLGRIESLIRQGRKWYTGVALALLLVAGIGGGWLFRARSDGLPDSPLVPWMLTVLFTAAYLPLVPTLCVIEGCGGLLRVQRMRLVQVILAVGVLWSVLLVWGSLWAVAAFAFAWLAVAGFWLQTWHPDLVSAHRRNERADEPREHRHGIDLISVQWRTGSTMLAWWAVPQALTPIVLATHGPAPAGQVGMSLAIALAPLTLAAAWLQGRYPRYGALVSQGKTKELRHVAWAATGQALFVCTIGTLAATTVVWLLGRYVPSLAARALPALAITILGMGNLAWLSIQSLAGYLRAWREEPLMESTILGASLVIVGTLIVASRASAAASVVSYSLLVVIVMLPLVVIQFRRRLRRTIA